MKVDLKKVLLKEANWNHQHFGIVASFIGGLGDNGVIEYDDET